MVRLLVVLSALIVGWVSVHAEYGFMQASPGREFLFPRDHGKHPDFQTEWWYFTGNVDAPDGSRWGFQLTFFRRGMVKAPLRNSRWAIRDLYPAHFAITDIKNKRFFHTEAISREGPGLAGAASDDLNVHLRDWRAYTEGEIIHIAAREDEYGINLAFSPEKPPILHGNAGYSRKGDSENQASYYYSFTRLKAQGTITYNGATCEVSGNAWMDHEFGSSILFPDQVGWDWFSLQMEDGSEIMLFHLRKRDGTVEKPFGTYVPREGPSVDLAGKDIFIRPVGKWISPNTKAVYPSGWVIDVPDLDINLEAKPFLSDQELFDGKSTGIVYWEGSVEITGMKRGEYVSGRGYVELTGYAHSLGGRL